VCETGTCHYPWIYRSMNIAFEQKVIASPEALVSVIAGESVILNCQNEQYYGLDEIGTDMWTKLTTSPTIQSAYEKLLQEYDVDADLLHQDICVLLGNLSAQGLVEIHAA
jgi:Coenzyme PQQ synthesis protein D (PqqD)